jgi:hypothetical protein
VFAREKQAFPDVRPEKPSANFFLATTSFFSPSCLWIYYSAGKFIKKIDGNRCQVILGQR